MKHLFAYVLVFGNIMAVLVVTLVQPQSALLHRKKMWDARQYLLAQMPGQCTGPSDPTCSYEYCGSNPGMNYCPTYMSYMASYMTCYNSAPPESGGNHGFYRLNTDTSAFACTYADSSVPPPTPWPWYTTGGGSGSSGSGAGLGYDGNYAEQVIRTNDCETELRYAPLKPGESARRLSAAGALLERDGKPMELAAAGDKLCFSAKKLFTGKNGDESFQNHRLEDALNDATNFALNHASDLIADPKESVDAWWKRIAKPYFSQVQAAFDAIPGDSPAFLIRPMLYATGGTLVDPLTKKTSEWKGLIPKIQDILAALLPAPKIADAPQEEPKKAEVAQTPSPAQPEAPAAQAPAPAPEPTHENFIRRIFAILKHKLGLDAVREQGIAQKTITLTPEQKTSASETTHRLLDIFGAERAKYCATHDAC